MVFVNFKEALLSTLALVSLAQAGTYSKVTENFGPNPRNVGFNIYLPSKLAANPPILVNPHWCHGNAQATYSGLGYPALAERYGFIIIYPDSPNTADYCWDVSSNQTLTHDLGGDSLGIVSMVRWALKKYNGDANRVFTTGISSGAMMTQVLVGAYPDVFAAGSAWAGVPFGCFAGNGYDVWSNACATGQISKSAADWANIVKAGYPGYTGWRPKLQVFHGTSDEVLNYQTFGEDVKQWTAVFGFSQTPTSVVQNTPKGGWTKNVYGNGWYEATSASGVTHNIGTVESVVMSFFDLACTGTNCFGHGKGGPAAHSVKHAKPLKV